MYILEYMQNCVYLFKELPNMIAIITGDIINSRAVDPNKWIVKLKDVLSSIGTEPKDWEIYRGDSFQLRIHPKHALHTSILLKSSIKQFKKLDIRIAIGIGEIDYEGMKITESNGSAFIHSGECFEALKKDNLAIKTSNKHFDKTINTMLSLASLTMDAWSPSASEIISLSLKNPTKKQIELAKILNKSQSNISIALKRGGYEEILGLLSYYEYEISKIC